MVIEGGVYIYIYTHVYLYLYRYICESAEMFSIEMHVKSEPVAMVFYLTDLYS